MLAGLHSSRECGGAPRTLCALPGRRAESSARHMEGLGAHPSAPLPLGGGISRSFVRPSLWPCHRWLPRLLCTDGGAVWPGSTRPSPWVPPPCSARPAALSSVTDCLCSEGSQPGEEEQALGCSVWPPAPPARRSFVCRRD